MRKFDSTLPSVEFPLIFSEKSIESGNGYKQLSRKALLVTKWKKLLPGYIVHFRCFYLPTETLSSGALIKSSVLTEKASKIARIFTSSCAKSKPEMKHTGKNNEIKVGNQAN